jgi:hypothetical protein
MKQNHLPLEAGLARLFKLLAGYEPVLAFEQREQDRRQERERLYNSGH